MLFVCLRISAFMRMLNLCASHHRCVVLSLRIFAESYHIEKNPKCVAQSTKPHRFRRFDELDEWVQFFSKDVVGHLKVHSVHCAVHSQKNTLAANLSIDQ